MREPRKIHAPGKHLMRIFDKDGYRWTRCGKLLASQYVLKDDQQKGVTCLNCLARLAGRGAPDVESFGNSDRLTFPILFAVGRKDHD